MFGGVQDTLKYTSINEGACHNPRRPPHQPSPVTLWRLTFNYSAIMASIYNFYCMSSYVNDLFCVFVYSNVPFRIRVRCARKRNEDEDSPHKFYTLVTHVAVDTFKGVYTHHAELEIRTCILVCWYVLGHFLVLVVTVRCIQVQLGCYLFRIHCISN